MIGSKSANFLSLSPDGESNPATADDSYEWQSDLFREFIVPSSAVHAQLLYRCEKTDNTVALGIRANRKWLESFRRFRVQCTQCQARHIVPAVLTFGTEE